MGKSSPPEEIEPLEQALNPDLIGASKALEEGDLETYAEIAAGLKHADLAELTSTFGDNLEIDSEI